MHYNELVYASYGNTSIKLLYIWFLVFPGGDAWVATKKLTSTLRNELIRDMCSDHLPGRVNFMRKRERERKRLL